MALIAAAKVALSRNWLPVWQKIQSRLSTGFRPKRPLVAQKMLVALLVCITGIRSQQRKNAIKRSQRQLEALLSENAAVARACRAVVRTLAQPLTGVLAYSELLMVDVAGMSKGRRYQVEELREGVLRIERLLQYLCEALPEVADTTAGHNIADDVEKAMSMPLSAQPFYWRRNTTMQTVGYEASSCNTAGCRNM